MKIHWLNTFSIVCISTDEWDSAQTCCSELLYPYHSSFLYESTTEQKGCRLDYTLTDTDTCLVMLNCIQSVYTNSHSCGFLVRFWSTALGAPVQPSVFRELTCRTASVLTSYYSSSAFDTACKWDSPKWVFKVRTKKESGRATPACWGSP